MKLALFGGTFDPIHQGHITIAACARREFKLDRVLFIPARQSPHKTDTAPGASARERCEMIEIAISDLPWASLWSGELDRSPPSYSWQTAAYFRNALPGSQLFWILGSDQWQVIDSWSRSDYLARSLTFLVFPRPAPPQPIPGFRMHALSATHPASSTDIRAGQFEHLHPGVERFVQEHGLYS
jgi:nicotinate-nucleotide adenylyltransferase